MQKYWFMQRRLWIVAAILLVILVACVAQTPSATAPTVAVEGTAETPAVSNTVEATTTETATVESTTVATSTEENTTPAAPAVAATEEQTTTKQAAPQDESVASASDGAADVVASNKGVTTTEATTPTNVIDLIGGEPIAGSETYKGIPVGFTANGFAYRGDPKAPIVMIEYSDFQCPYCNRFFVQTEPAVDESYVRTGQVRVVFHDFPLVSLHPNAPAAHEASLCIQDQGSAERYWTYNASLFRDVNEWEGMADPQPVFERLAKEASADMDAYQACISSHKMQNNVQDRVNQAFARGFNATPSFQMVRMSDNAIFQLIGAQPYEQFASVVDSALAGEMPSVAQQPQQQQQQPQQGIPFWATAEGWKPDPNRPGFNMAGDEYRGDVNAPLTVIEFSDFQCPFCLRHQQETQPALDKNYVDTGKVLWVYKNFPLNIHPQAPAAAIAGECAADQGKFWEMHDALFNSVEKWSIDDPTEVFKSLASDLGLNVDTFAACLTDPKIKERVDSDESEGAQYVQGTPTFIIVHGDQGSIIPGALPEATFAKVLDEQLSGATSGSSQQ
jgi:protein-disulfide isomerase